MRTVIGSSFFGESQKIPIQFICMIAIKQASLDLHRRRLGELPRALAGADLLGLAVPVVIDEEPKHAVTFTNFDSHYFAPFFASTASALGVRLPPRLPSRGACVRSPRWRASNRTSRTRRRRCGGRQRAASLVGVRLPFTNAQANRERKVRQIASGATAVYNSNRWRKLRAMKRSQDPMCEQCAREGRITPAQQVDHREPIARRPDRVWDLTNLESLCIPCHSRKTFCEIKARS